MSGLIPEGLNRLEAEIQRIINGIDYSPLLPQIELIVMTSIDRNFSEGGRYGNANPFGGGRLKWKKSKRAIRQGGQTLVDSGQLAASIRVRAYQANGYIFIEAGSTKIYAAIHNFGGYNGRGRKVRQPARPFLVLQDEDLVEIQLLMTEFIRNYLRPFGV